MFDSPRFLVEHCDEFVADDFSFLFRIDHTRQPGEKSVGGVDRLELKSKLLVQVLLHFFKLVFSQHAIVDEYAGQARFPVLAQCAVH